MRNVWQWIVVVVFVVGLSACGGGGGNSEKGYSSDVRKLSSHKTIPSKLIDVIKGNSSPKKQLSSSHTSSSKQCNQIGLYMGRYRGQEDKGKSLSMIFPGGGTIFVAYSSYFEKDAFYGAGYRNGSEIRGDYYDFNNNKQGIIHATLSGNEIDGRWTNTKHEDHGTLESSKLLQFDGAIYEHTGFLLYDDNSLAAIYDIQVYDDNRMYGFLLLPNSEGVEVTGEYNENDNSFTVESESIDGTRVKLSGHIGSSDFGGVWKSDNGLKGTIVGRGCYITPNNKQPEATLGEFNTKVQGFWVEINKNGSCYENKNKGMSSKAAVDFSRKDRFAFFIKTYSELGCVESDKDTEYVYRFNYAFNKRLHTSDDSLAEKLPDMFSMTATFVGVEERKGTLDKKPKRGTKYYITVGLTSEGDLELARNTKGTPFSKDSSDKPRTFRVNDDFRFVKH